MDVIHHTEVKTGSNPLIRWCQGDNFHSFTYCNNRCALRIVLYCLYTHTHTHTRFVKLSRQLWWCSSVTCPSVDSSVNKQPWGLRLGAQWNQQGLEASSQKECKDLVLTFLGCMTNLSSILTCYRMDKTKQLGFLLSSYKFFSVLNSLLLKYRSCQIPVTFYCVDNYFKLRTK